MAMIHPFIQRSLMIIVLGAVPVTSALAGFEFIPPSSSSVLAAPRAPMEPQGMGMPSSPASSVVSQALSNSAAQTAPQSILPPAAPSAPRYTLAPAASGPTINMNPMAASGANSADGREVGQLERAMIQNALGTVPRAEPANSMGRASLGGMPLPPASSANYSEAVGFGRDLPLALAVSQIVPPDYAFVFDPSVNPGEDVSWEGGKSWDAVLNETLAPVGASARIDESKKEVRIVSGAATDTPATYSAYTPPALAPRAPAAQPALYTAEPAITPAPMNAVPAAPAVTSSPKMQLAGLARPDILDPKAVRLWEAQRGSTLRTILNDWSLQAGVELFWSSDFDFPVESAIRIKGTFEEAIQTLLNGLRDAQPRPIGRLHPNLPEGPSVLVIETKHVLE